MSNLEPPFEELYVVVIPRHKKIYSSLSVAKAQVTSAVDQYHGTQQFLYDCELWALRGGGWELLFSAKKGDSYTIIPWDNAARIAFHRAV